MDTPEPGDGDSSEDAEPKLETDRDSTIRMMRAVNDRAPVNPEQYDSPFAEPGHSHRYDEATVLQAEVLAKQAAEDLRLRRMIARRIFWAVIIQVAIADIAFFIYGFSNDWRVPASTIEAWLGSTVVQVIGVSLVVTRSLFPVSVKERKGPPASK